MNTNKTQQEQAQTSSSENLKIQSIRVNKELWDKFGACAKLDGVKIYELLNDVLTEYVKKRNINIK